MGGRYRYFSRLGVFTKFMESVHESPRGSIFTSETVFPQKNLCHPPSIRQYLLLYSNLSAIIIIQQFIRHLLQIFIQLRQRYLTIFLFTFLLRFSFYSFKLWQIKLGHVNASYEYMNSLSPAPKASARAQLQVNVWYGPIAYKDSLKYFSRK
jgi:hypothetical protein